MSKQHAEEIDGVFPVSASEILKTIELKNTQGDKNLAAFWAATEKMSPSDRGAFESFIVGWFAATAKEKDWLEAINMGRKAVMR
jgi:hypothetical protein